MQLLKTCDEISSHIVMLNSEGEYRNFLEAPISHLTSLNGSLITVNTTVSDQKVTGVSEADLCSTV